MNGNELVYRLLLAVDIQAYSKRSTREQLQAQHSLTRALDRAALGIGLERARWDKQVGGDGELATLPEGVDPAPVAGDFVIGLASELRALNGAREDGPPLRVRLALHHGTMTAGPFGPAGDAPIVVQRLLDSAPLRRLLADDPGRDLAYVVSESLYGDVVRTGFCSLPPAAFQAVKVTAKGTAFRGHILTGRTEAHGAPGRDGRRADRGGPGDRSAPPPGARVIDFPQLIRQRA
ncbi:hypothetical protein GCM10010191_93880 [Actinomadura vinacea]|uniref:Uncharacterized protein n=1 Tax=Actinomadura vinacea TaxID=115336 RepID=A0ABP5XPY3_9ACTN